jgi:CheY-like chemotaxis protein
LTGYGTEEDVSRTRNVGFDAHMTKPIRIQALDDTLARLAPPVSGAER